MFPEKYKIFPERIKYFRKIITPIRNLNTYFIYRNCLVKIPSYPQMINVPAEILVPLLMRDAPLRILILKLCPTVNGGNGKIYRVLNIF